MRIELDVRHLGKDGPPTAHGYYLTWIRLENQPTIVWHGRDGFRRNAARPSVTYYAGPLPDLGTPVIAKPGRDD